MKLKRQHLFLALSTGTAHFSALHVQGATTTSFSIAVWGDDSQGQTNVPSGLLNVPAAAAGASHSFALRKTPTTAAWGWNFYGQTVVPAGLKDAGAGGRSRLDRDRGPAVHLSRQRALSWFLSMQLQFAARLAGTGADWLPALRPGPGALIRSSCRRRCRRPFHCNCRCPIEREWPPVRHFIRAFSAAFPPNGRD
jgi:hypothetical protein